MTAPELIARADEVLYQAKRAGRNRVAIAFRAPSERASPPSLQSSAISGYVTSEARCDEAACGTEDGLKADRIWGQL
jgi:hypothetical protein